MADSFVEVKWHADNADYVDDRGLNIVLICGHLLNQRYPRASHLYFIEIEWH